MQTISIGTVIELKNLLAENNIEFKIHLSDTCGKQSLWMEQLNPNIPFSGSFSVLDILLCSILWNILLYPEN